MPSSLAALRVSLLGLTLLSYVVVFTVAKLTAFRIEYSSICSSVIFAAVFLVGFSRYCFWRGMYPLVSLVEVTVGIFALSLPIAISTYLAARCDQPLADGKLMAIDATIGFHWEAFIRYVDAQPVLAALLGLAYQSFMFQLLAMPIILCLSKAEKRAYVMAICFGLIGLISAAVSTWFPALGTYTAYEFDQRSLVNLNTHFGYFFLHEFMAVRSDPNFVFSLSRAAGIVTFPSVHAAVALLCAWAAWDVKLIRYPILLLNVFMAVSAVSDANHYVVDIFAGFAIALACILLVPLLVALCNQKFYLSRKASATSVSV